ncbi:MAG: DUF4252 domain-containing protein [Bacteroidota bacterium]
MKNSLFLFLFLFISSPFFAQVQTIDDFYAKHKREGEAMSLNLPGFLIRLGASIASLEAEDEAERVALEIVKDVRRAKILAGENLRIGGSEIQQLVSDLATEGFEELMTVRSEGSTMNVIIRERKDIIRSVVLIVNDNGDFTLISLKTRLYLEDLTYLINKSLES